jgi:acetylornithine deacetylase/succinyl-diaminopimelate desuccinylase-like protein
VEDKNPVVIGRLRADPALPTVTFYGHYDVQPAMEREWASDPFEVAAIDGYLYGRGTSDNKAGASFWRCLPLSWLGFSHAAALSAML